MKATLFCFTKKGEKVCKRVKASLKLMGYETKGYSKYKSKEFEALDGNLTDLTKYAFENDNALIFVGAIGIAVRTIANFIARKDMDPQVLVIDELGIHVIPVLSCHIGGANKTAIEVAKHIGGRAVITTATDLNNVFAIDIWAKEQNLHIENIDMIKEISGALLNGEKIGFHCDFPLKCKLPVFFSSKEKHKGICISDDSDKTVFTKTLNLVPIKYVVGVGCRKGVDSQFLEEKILDVLKKHKIAKEQVKCVASIDLKSEEPAINLFCSKYKIPFITYSSENLRKVKGDFDVSTFVEKTTGVNNVCERAAIAASKKGELFLKKTKLDKITIAIVKEECEITF